eukprot:GHUV01040493.1.p1 GENE.GHUV01040493.1~~GHUV01040493.1.p1  ORF type:complete len:105 (+),score=36.05 GHUV01040493.1:654-968(+)
MRHIKCLRGSMHKELQIREDKQATITVVVLLGQLVTDTDRGQHLGKELDTKAATAAGFRHCGNYERRFWKLQLLAADGSQLSNMEHCSGTCTTAAHKQPLAANR